MLMQFSCVFRYVCICKRPHICEQFLSECFAESFGHNVCNIKSIQAYGLANFGASTM